MNSIQLARPQFGIVIPEPSAGVETRIKMLESEIRLLGHQQKLTQTLADGFGKLAGQSKKADEVNLKFGYIPTDFPSGTEKKVTIEQEKSNKPKFSRPSGEVGTGMNSTWLIPKQPQFGEGVFEGRDSRENDPFFNRVDKGPKPEWIPPQKTLLQKLFEELKGMKEVIW